MAEVLDIKIDQGASFFLPRILLDPLGNPVDLTGYSGRGSIKAKAQDAAPVASFVIDIPNPTTGQYNVRLPAEVSALIPLTGAAYDKPTKFCYDVELYNTTSQNVARVLNGIASVSPEVTK